MMEVVRRLNRSQRIVLVIGLAAACLAIDAAVGGPRGGWFGYAPQSSLAIVPGDGLSRQVRVALRIALTVAWTAASMWLLKSDDQ